MNVNFYTPVVTAFDENGELDLQGNKNIYDHLIGGGIAGLLILGSSGEFYALNMEQKKTLIDMAVPYINKRAKVFFGTACDSMEETVELSNYALRAGADGVIIEVHNDPKHALCDGAQSLTPTEFDSVMHKLSALKGVMS